MATAGESSAHEVRCCRPREGTEEGPQVQGGLQLLGQVADPRRRVKMTKGKATDAGGSMDIGRKLTTTF